MANLQQPEDGGSTLPADDNLPAGMTAKGAGRRRFAAASAGASAGVILTLTSQPGMAAQMCLSPSAKLSGNTSHAHELQVPCEGRSAGFWSSHLEAWPAAQTSPDTLFGAIFTTGTYRTTLLTPYTCMQVLQPQDVKLAKKGGFATVDPDPDNVAMHIMATLLNVRSGRIGFLTENQVTGMWNSYAATGTYQPTVGVTWDGAKIVEYLKQTMS